MQHRWSLGLVPILVVIVATAGSAQSGAAPPPAGPAGTSGASSTSPPAVAQPNAPTTLPGPGTQPAVPGSATTAPTAGPPSTGAGATAPTAGQASPGAGATTIAPSMVPDSFRGIRLGMTLGAVETALTKDPYFNYRGPPDVSMLASPDENLIETSGYSFISRAFFQFYRKKLYIMILMLNPSEISYYTMYTTLVGKYGPSTSLSPEEVVWESPEYRLSLERPLSVKYLDRSVFDGLKAAGKMKQSEQSISREQFLNQF